MEPPKKSPSIKKKIYMKTWALYLAIPIHFIIKSSLQSYILGGSVSKESACNAGDGNLIPESERSPGEGKWQPTPVFLPQKCHGQRSLADYSPWGGQWVGHDWVTNQQLCLVPCAQSLSRVWFFATGSTRFLYSPPGFSIHGIFQARMLEQVSIS